MTKKTMKSGGRSGIKPKKKTTMPANTAKMKTPAKATKSGGTKEKNVIVKIIDPESKFPKEFPFWARLKISKNRTTLVIDEALAKNKKTNEMEEGFVHREATHSNPRGDFEEIKPNPDREDPEPMYLKRPRKHPKRLFEPHNKRLDMPESLKKRYEKNNHKDDGDKKQ